MRSPGSTGNAQEAGAPEGAGRSAESGSAGRRGRSWPARSCGQGPSLRQPFTTSRPPSLEVEPELASRVHDVLGIEVALQGPEHLHLLGAEILLQVGRHHPADAVVMAQRGPAI